MFKIYSYPIKWGEIRMKKLSIFFSIFLIFSGIIFSYNLTLVSKGEADHIAMNWIYFINKMPFEGKLDKYEIRFIEQVDDHGVLLCEIYHLYPNGHIVIPSYKEFPPIKSFSVVSDFNSKSEGYEYAILQELKAAFKFLKDYQIGELDELESALEMNIQQWNKLIQIGLKEAIIEEFEIFQENNESDICQFIIRDRSNILMEAVKASPLLKTKWHQRLPYQNSCPTLRGNRCVVGCVATAMAQIMRYYKWPKSGEGSHSYYWEEGNKWLSAYFSDTYDWEYMPNETWEYNTSRENNAVAELCYEAGVSVEMRYSYYDGSYAFPRDVVYALKKFFKYSNQVKIVDRKDYSNVNNWFEVFKEQRDLIRPVEFAMYKMDEDGHAGVIDGYLISGGSQMVHINMGWGGPYDAYYSLDNILEYTNYDWQKAVIDIVPAGAYISLNKTSLSFTGAEGDSSLPPDYFKIRNSQQRLLNYQINTNKDWINVDPDSGETQGGWDKIEVVVNIAELIEGSHTGKIIVSSVNASNSPQEIDVKLKVKRPPIYPPQKFSGRKVENRSSSQIEYINALTWQSNPSNRHIEIYRIYLVEDQESILLTELNADTFQYWHRKVEKNKNYKYRLRAIDYKNREGPSTYCEVQ